MPEIGAPPPELPDLTIDPHVSLAMLCILAAIVGVVALYAMAVDPRRRKGRK